MQPPPCLRIASRSVYVPMMLVRMNGSGSCSELSTCDSAAKCTTMSASRQAVDKRGVADVAVDELDLVGDRLRLSRSPA